MEAFDGEVEFLDEDVDIVQKYVTKPINVKVNKPFIYTAKQYPMHIKKKRKRRPDADEEYIPDVGPNKKKPKKEFKRKDVVVSKRKYKRNIPDYTDSIFLPVKVMPKNLENATKIKRWNKCCVEQYMKADDLLESGEDVMTSSVKTLVFRRVKNKITGKVEPMVCGKTKVTYLSGKEIFDDFQCMLPNFSDNKNLNYRVYPQRNTGDMVLSQNTVLLSCEKQRGSEFLVAYMPIDRVSINYKFVDKRNSKTGSVCDRLLEEQCMYNVCALCYQNSWNGNGYLPQKKKIICSICHLNFGNTYNMLTHLKTHSKELINENRSLITSSLADLVGNHYKCRICQQRFNTVKELQVHVFTHRGTSCFKCVVGNHVTR